MKYLILPIIWILGSLLICLFIPPQVLAQTNTPGGVAVSPSIIRLDLATDKPETTLVYTNSTTQSVEIDLTSSNFTDLEDGYKVSFLEGKSASNYKYGLSSWISFDKDSFVLAPRQTEKIQVSVSREKLSPGGHYGSILAKISSSTPEHKLTIQGTLVSLLFVRTNTGIERDEMKLQKFAQVQNLFFFPDSFVLRVNNTGDTDLTPYGIITVKNFLGQTAATSILNEGSLTTLPETIRRYDTPVKRSTPFLLPGIYTAKLSLHYGKQNKRIKSEVTFLSVGSIPLIPLGALLLVGTVILAVKRKHKRTEEK